MKDLSKEILIELTNDDNKDTDLIDLEDQLEQVVINANEQITAADEEIDSYLRARYVLPIITVPNRLKQISKDISIYNLYKRRHRQDLPEGIVNIYKDKIKELLNIQAGKIDIGVPEAPQNMANEIVVNKSSSDKIFTDDVLSQY